MSCLGIIFSYIFASFLNNIFLY